MAIGFNSIRASDSWCRCRKRNYAMSIQRLFDAVERRGDIGLLPLFSQYRTDRGWHPAARARSACVSPASIRAARIWRPETMLLITRIYIRFWKRRNRSSRFVVESRSSETMDTDEPKTTSTNGWLRAERDGGLTQRLGNNLAFRIDLAQTIVCGHGHGDHDEVGPGGSFGGYEMTPERDDLTVVEHRICAAKEYIYQLESAGMACADVSAWSSCHTFMSLPRLRLPEFHCLFCLDSLWVKSQN